MTVILMLAMFAIFLTIDYWWNISSASSRLP
jgi:hypothetical protein